ncbi:hypothetical protein [Nocardia sp. NPDC004260]
MGWSIGFDTNWRRDIGYGVPAQCDHPDCGREIHRGLAYVCGGQPYGGERGCGLYFCESHLLYSLPDDDTGGDQDAPQRCERCIAGGEPYTPTADVQEWLSWKLNDESWATWRAENPQEVVDISRRLAAANS